LAGGAASELKSVDSVISGQTKNWNFKRLSSVDRALLRLGVFEILHCPETPREVTINECIELAKLYGTDESPAFVNGVLDQIGKAEKALQ
jgi:N utilization substance protein B